MLNLHEPQPEFDHKFPYQGQTPSSLPTQISSLLQVQESLRNNAYIYGSELRETKWGGYIKLSSWKNKENESCRSFLKSNGFHNSMLYALLVLAKMKGLSNQGLSNFINHWNREKGMARVNQIRFQIWE